MTGWESEQPGIRAASAAPPPEVDGTERVVSAPGPGLLTDREREWLRLPGTDREREWLRLLGEDCPPDSSAS
ncbi:hypothetical protein IGX29_03055 [Streptomyces sp. H28]|uniref:hypothetical protein n=1 Tax=Streptomyces sp. H28 TaxID=2775865 RepID=UPI00177FA296|nr:hypothetical protein [Streptomyces sp. H28]MBD9730809.1 hypothetical protein [Streptomyces sp. H28]